MSVEDQLSTLIDTKRRIRLAIADTGVDTGVNPPFNEYPDFIRQIPVTRFEQVTVKHQNFNMKTTYYNADIDQVWTGATVNFGGNLYDLDPSMIVSGKTVLGITGETATRADNDYNIMDDDFDEHRKRIDFIRASNIFNNSVYNNDYYEGLFIAENGILTTVYVFCLRNFDITSCTGTINKQIKYKGAITVTYQKNTGEYTAQYNLDTECNNYCNVSNIIYASRYLYYGYFDSGHPYMPMQIYPKPFEVTLNLRDYLLQETTKLRFKYRGNGLLVRMCIDDTDDNYCFNWDNQTANNGWYNFSVNMHEIPDLLDKTNVRLIIVGHITGLQNVDNSELEDGGFVQGMFSCSTKVNSPLPHEMRNCSYLFKNSPIDGISSNLMKYCYNTIESVDGIFYGCTNLQSTVNNLFEKCTKLKYFDYVYARCPNLHTITLNCFNTKSAIISVDHAFEGDYIQNIPWDFLQPIAATLKSARYMFAHYAESVNSDQTYTITLRLENLPELNDISYILTESPKVKKLTFISENTPKLQTLHNVCSHCENLESAEVTMHSTALAINLYGAFMECHKLVSIGWAFTSASFKVINCMRAFYNDAVLSYCLPWWENPHFSLATYTECYKNCTKASNYLAAEEAVWT